MGALSPLALGLAPELGQWLFGATAERAAAAITEAVQRATGVTDPEAAGAALAADPQATSQLRWRLAEISADLAETARRAELDGLMARLRDMVDTTVPRAAPAVAGEAQPETQVLATTRRSLPEGATEDERSAPLPTEATFASSVAPATTTRLDRSAMM